MTATRRPAHANSPKNRGAKRRPPPPPATRSASLKATETRLMSDAKGRDAMPQRTKTRKVLRRAGPTSGGAGIPTDFDMDVWSPCALRVVARSAYYAHRGTPPAGDPGWPEGRCSARKTAKESAAVE